VVKIWTCPVVHIPDFRLFVADRAFRPFAACFVVYEFYRSYDQQGSGCVVKFVMVARTVCRGWINKRTSMSSTACARPQAAITLFYSCSFVLDTRVMASVSTGFVRVQAPMTMRSAAFVVLDPVVRSAAQSVWAANIDIVDKCNAVLSVLREHRVVSDTAVVFRTPLQACILQQLYDRCDALMNKAYQAKNGQGSSVTLVGPRMNGKTTTLMVAQVVMPALFEGLHAVYIPSDQIRGDLVRRVSCALHESTTEHDYAAATTEMALESALVKHHHRLLLMVDELDGLYETMGNKQVFDDLSAFGDTLSGHIVTILCGSHPILPLLVTTEAKNTVAAGVFRALNGDARDLNGTKFEPVYLPFTHLINADPEIPLEVMREIVAQSCTEKLDDSTLGGIVFSFGAHIRRVQLALALLLDGEVMRVAALKLQTSHVDDGPMHFIDGTGESARCPCKCQLGCNFGCSRTC
jgi:hypothetical protein